MIIGKWLRNAYLKMENELAKRGIPRETIESYVDLANETFVGYPEQAEVPDPQKTTVLESVPFCGFFGKHHTADAIRHMYRVAAFKASEQGIHCIWCSLGFVSWFFAL